MVTELQKRIKKTRNKLSLGGDGRCCSPGHTAKYGSYSIIDMETQKILDFQLIQSNEVRSSNSMELEGFERCMAFLKENKLGVKDITTDRHVQIKKYLRQKMTNVTHFFDAWHISKGSACHKLLKDIVLKRNLLADIGEVAPSSQTSALESYHKIVIYFAPKSMHFFYDSMLSRLQLSAMHFNENSVREQAVDKSGNPQFKLSYPKARHGAPVAKEVKVPITYNYLSDCMNEVIRLRMEHENHQAASRAWKEISVASEKGNVVDKFDRTDIVKEEVVLAHVSRFNLPVKSK
ncbi:uncharacterized protein LOC141904327 [Tubulanus polymorphus]|uniref:uncharacterized protein LOC141904327 n=1 Tax=Tubulanus polymorphus TaxID=672921 RepID=UPI003DA6A304